MLNPRIRKALQNLTVEDFLAILMYISKRLDEILKSQAKLLEKFKKHGANRN